MIENIKTLLNSKGYELLEIESFPHKDDSFLKIIVAKKSDTDYVCWVYNDNDNAVYEGYYTTTYDLAYEKMMDRIS